MANFGASAVGLCVHLGVREAPHPGPPPHPVPRSPRETPRSALSQLAWAHAHETLIWASKDKRSRHTFNYDLINSPDPTSQVSSVWHIPAVPMREKSHGRHPTQKPLRLVSRAVAGLHRGRRAPLRPLLRVWNDGGCGQRARPLLRGGGDGAGVTPQLAGRSIGAAVRGKVLRELRAVDHG